MQQANHTQKILNIQLFAGPSAGKSTISSGLFYNMKIQGYNVEFIAEYAKGLTYSQDYTKLKDQLMVFANQYHKFFRTKDSNIDYLIHESPALMTLAYFTEDEIIKEEFFSPLVVNMYNNMNNLNIFLERNLDNGYQQFGRNQTLEEAIEIDNKILKILDDNNIQYIKIKSDNNAVGKILEIIELSKNKAIDLHNNNLEFIHIGNLSNKIKDTKFIDYCKELAVKYKLNGRTFKDVLEHTIYGEAIEDTVCKKFGLTKIPFEISEYDAEKDGKKYEIKHTISESDWWVFNPDGYQFFFQNAKNLDYIILIYLNKQTNDIYLKYVANAKTFKDYCRKSSYNEKYIYDVRSAEINNEVKSYKIQN